MKVGQATGNISGNTKEEIGRRRTLQGGTQIASIAKLQYQTVR
jgi:hypothetical protein